MRFIEFNGAVGGASKTASSLRVIGQMSPVKQGVWLKHQGYPTTHIPSGMI